VNFISVLPSISTLKDIVKLYHRWWDIDMRHFYVSFRSVPIVIRFIDVGCFMSYVCDSPSCLSTIRRCNDSKIINYVKDMMCCGYAFSATHTHQCPDGRSLDVCQLRDENWNDNKMKGRKREWIINNLKISCGFVAKIGEGRDWQSVKKMWNGFHTQLLKIFCFADWYVINIVASSATLWQFLFFWWRDDVVV
jgi:hypothetical protein